MKADAMSCGLSGVLGPDDQDRTPCLAKVQSWEMQEVQEILEMWRMLKSEVDLSDQSMRKMQQQMEWILNAIRKALVQVCRPRCAWGKLPLCPKGPLL
jgi:hypothetical protein